MIGNAAGAETGTCPWCRKDMPSDALQCPSCHNWRREIHLLIEAYRKLALGQIATMIIGVLLALGVCLWRLEDAIEGNGVTIPKRFSFAKFQSTPSFAIVVFIVVLTVVVYGVTQVFAVRYRRRIQQATMGLWQRPWWTF